MKIIAIVVVVLSACVVPDPQGGDNAPDVAQAPTPDAAVEEKSALPPDWEGWGLRQCHTLCRQIRDYATWFPQEYGWCAPTYWDCYLPCASDNAHVPALCWRDFERWAYEEIDELPSPCGSHAWDPPYSYWAETYRDRYRQCWQLNVRATR